MVAPRHERVSVRLVTQMLVEGLFDLRIEASPEALTARGRQTGTSADEVAIDRACACAHRIVDTGAYQQSAHCRLPIGPGAETLPPGLEGHEAHRIAMPEPRFGRVVLFGSGETSSTGGRIFEVVARRLFSPLCTAVLETPAGFELNSDQVAGRVADFIRLRLQNYRPEVLVIPARKRNTPLSPDNHAILRPLLRANMIFLGPGSPTYAVRQLEDSLVWHMLLACHRLGAALVLASAATLAFSAHTLPVYEIYKVGEDLHWRNGLDFFSPYGLSLVFIPHWNNTEGGTSLDTSRCFMGRERFAQLLALLPPAMTIVGIDEHTALVIDLEAAACEVLGNGGVSVIKAGEEQPFASGATVELATLGPFRLPESAFGIRREVWDEVQAAHAAGEAMRLEPPVEVLALVEQRQAARAQRAWATADALRQSIATLGWKVLDTPDGPLLEPLSE